MLGPSARIAVVAPASAPNPARLKSAMALVRAWGYELFEGRHLWARERYTAGTRAQRLEDLDWALTDPDIDALWFARGGFGSAHSLGALDLANFDGRPVIGFSDATGLLGVLANHGHVSIHGPVLETLAPGGSAEKPLKGIDAASLQNLRELLKSGSSAPFPGQRMSGPADSLRARVVGGNLSVIASLMGTPFALNFDDSIAIFEDVNEPLYSLDRLATQLMQSGALSLVKAIAFGSFKGCGVGADISPQDLLADSFAPLGVPIYQGLPTGHGSSNHAWLHGASATLSAGGLKFVEPA